MTIYDADILISYIISGIWSTLDVKIWSTFYIRTWRL